MSLEMIVTIVYCSLTLVVILFCDVPDDDSGYFSI